MWFAAIAPQYASLVPAFHAAPLKTDAPTLRLLRSDPFDGQLADYVRAQLYRYRFTTAAELRRDHAWWHRSLEATYLRPLSLSGEAASQHRG